MLKKIAAEQVPGSEGFMSDKRTAKKDAFITEGSHALSSGHDKITPENATILKRVSFLLNTDGTLKYYIPVPYGWCELWDGKPEACSWYA